MDKKRRKEKIQKGNFKNSGLDRGFFVVSFERGLREVPAESSDGSG